MRFILTALLILAGMVFTGIGIGFLLNPANSAVGFGLEAIDPSGLAALRADFTAFFVVAGVCMIWGGWRRNGDVLLIPAALFAIAITGRIVSIVGDGTVEGFWLPMLVEAASVALCLVGNRLLPHRDSIVPAPL